MSDFVPQDPNLRLPGQPWTSAKAIADAENLIAVAEGADGAPRVRARARALEFFGQISLADTNAGGFNNMDPLTLVRIDAFGRAGTNNRQMQIRTSSDNGSSYGNWFNIIDSGDFNREGISTVAGYLNCITGIFSFSACALTSGSAVDSVSRTESGNIDAGRTNVNAFQMRHSNSSSNLTFVANAVSRGNLE